MKLELAGAVRAARDLLRWSVGWRGRVQVARVLARYLAAPPSRAHDQVMVEIGPARFWVRPGRSDIGTVREVWVEEVYEQLPSFRGRPGWVVVDGGAHIGTYTVRQALRVGHAGRVVAVEPDPDSFSRLEEHLRLNGLGNVAPIRLALSDHSGSARFAQSLDNPTVSWVMRGQSLPGLRWREIQVETTTLDLLAREMELGAVDVLKLDVEGMEELALLGGRDLLARTTRVVVESHAEVREAVRRLLERAGFAFQLQAGTVSYYERVGT